MDEQTKANRASKGGEARMQKLSREERHTLAKEAAKARWGRVKNQGVAEVAGIEPPRADSMPEAKYPGILSLAGVDIPYEYLDPDVAQWLRDNAPTPSRGQNYHQWLSEQYGLRKLIEHIWKVIGIASTCGTVDELRHNLERLYGTKKGFQFRFKLVSGDHDSTSGATH